jgi:hypothetical protein
LRFQCGGIVHDERAIAELYRIGSPLSKVSILVNDYSGLNTDNTSIA